MCMYVRTFIHTYINVCTCIRVWCLVKVCVVTRRVHCCIVGTGIACTHMCIDHNPGL